MCSNLENMDLPECCGTIQNLPDELLLEIFQYMSLEDLVTCIQNVSLRWRNVSQNSFRLWKNLIYKPQSKISDKEIIDTLKKMPQLRSFILHSRCLKVDEIINVLCSHCKYLQTLICDCAGVSTPHLQKIVNSLHILEYFQLSPCQMIDDTSFSLLSKFKNLRKLTCVNVGPASTFIKPNKDVFQCLEHIEIIAYCSSDIQVHNHQRNVGNHFLHLVPHMKNLKHLFIDFRMLHFSGFEKVFCNLKNLHNLETLCFKSFFHSDEHILTKMFELCSFPKLRKLDLSNCLNIYVQTVQAIHRSCPLVQELHFSRCVYFNDECTQALTRFTELCLLDLSCCNKVSDVGLISLRHCPKLEVLDLSWRSTIVPHSFFSALRNLPHLKGLILDHTHIPHDEMVRYLTSNHKMIYLGLYCCKGVYGDILQNIVAHCHINQNHMHEVMCPYSKILKHT